MASEIRCDVRALLGNEGGQTLLLTVMVLVVLAVSLLTLLDIGEAVHEKIVLQDAADAAAYSAAVWEARFMNLAAYTNRAMVAHLATVSEMVSIVNTLKAISQWLQAPCHAWPTSVKDAMVQMGEQLWASLAPISMAASAVIGLAQETNDLLSHVQLQQFEMTKILINAEIYRMAKFNDPKATPMMVGGSNRRLKRTLTRENLLGFTGTPANPKFYRHIESTNFLKPRYGQNPYLRTSPVWMTDFPPGQGWRTMQYKPYDPEKRPGMVDGALPQLSQPRNLPGFLRVLGQLNRFFLNGESRTRTTPALDPSGCPTFNCLGERWRWEHNILTDVNIAAHDRWSEKACRAGLLRSKCRWCRFDAFSHANCNHVTLQTQGEYRLGDFKDPRGCAGMRPAEPQFRGVPSFIQLRRDAPPKTCPGCGRGNRSGDDFTPNMPNVFVVLSKPTILARTQPNVEGEPAGGSLSGGGEFDYEAHPAGYVRKEIKLGIARNAPHSPVIGSYRPNLRREIVAFSRARVVYRGHLYGSPKEAASRASLFNPYWNVQLYPFYGDPGDGDDDGDLPPSAEEPGSSVQANIIRNLGPTFTRRDLRRMLGDAAYPADPRSARGRLITH